ncbi:hypothetical protein BC830DRAFT_1216614 [Chytriomyces sp. MP71]|nr:hypothetical protein BC830DRAFT_1216614 [Chytriomyces sp. MP71]
MELTNYALNFLKGVHFPQHNYHQTARPLPPPSRSDTQPPQRQHPHEPGIPKDPTLHPPDSIWSGNPRLERQQGLHIPHPQKLYPIRPAGTRHLGQSTQHWHAKSAASNNADNLWHGGPGVSLMVREHVAAKGFAAMLAVYTLAHVPHRQESTVKIKGAVHYSLARVRAVPGVTGLRTLMVAATAGKCINWRILLRIFGREYFAKRLIAADTGDKFEDARLLFDEVEAEACANGFAIGGCVADAKQGAGVVAVRTSSGGIASLFGVVELSKLSPRAVVSFETSESETEREYARDVLFIARSAKGL